MCQANQSASGGDGREVIIRVENLTAAYNDVVALSGVSFEVRRGEIFVILGGSGCGKSTLMKHMIGLYEPAAGRVLIEGQDLCTAAGEARRRMLNRIGVAYQSGALFGSMSVLENVRLPLEEFTDLPPIAVDIVARMKLRAVGVDHAAEMMPSELSGGMAKRAAIARAIALDPAVVFLDEPSAGLDPTTSAELDELILRLRDSLDMTFVIVSHELPSVFTVADRAIMLDADARGAIAIGTPGHLRDESEDPRVRRFFRREPASARPADTEAECNDGGGPE